jgi:hypothetical protein
MEPWMLTMKVWMLKMEAWTVCRPVIADLDHLDGQQDLDPIEVKVGSGSASR